MDSKNNADANISDNALTNALNKAKEEALKSSTNKDDVFVNIKIIGAKDVNTLFANISEKAVKDLIQAGTDQLIIDNEKLTTALIHKE